MKLGRRVAAEMGRCGKGGGVDVSGDAWERAFTW